MSGTVACTHTTSLVPRLHLLKLGWRGVWHIVLALTFLFQLRNSAAGVSMQTRNEFHHHGWLLPYSQKKPPVVMKFIVRLYGNAYQHLRPNSLAETKM